MSDSARAPLGAGLDGSGPCPCGRGTPFAGCCRPLLHGRPAITAEDLMRSRYTAFVVGDVDHLFRSWHPRSRPVDLSLPADRTWAGLRVVATRDGGADDQTGTVEFAASYRTPAGPGVQREVSRFGRRGPRWVYVDGLG